MTLFNDASQEASLALAAFDETKATPMMAQWYACKQKAQEAVLLFRMGDFYEAFYEDALLLSKELDLTLTKRQEIPMSGVPAHTCDTYIDKLVAKGFRVAIAEQVEDPKQAKGLVRREITRIVTPGTLINSDLLSEKNNNFFAALAKAGDVIGLSFLDLTTGECFACEFENSRDLVNELFRLRPSEILLSEGFKQRQASLLEEIQQMGACLVNTAANWYFEPETALNFLVRHFKVSHLEGFGLQGKTSAINASGALLRYCQEALCLHIDSIQSIESYSTSHFMLLDKMTQRNLELSLSLRDGKRKHTLLDVIDQTQTPMGGRLMARWIQQPLLSLSAIKERQQAISAFLEEERKWPALQALLAQIRDIERMMIKVCSAYASPRDLLALHRSFLPLESLKSSLAALGAFRLQTLAALIDPLPEMNDKISRALVEEPPLRLGEGKIFREGYHSEIDMLRSLSSNGKEWIARYQAQLREETGIKTLKVGFNNMFGYYIEVSKGQTDRMPETFLRRQTLVNAERYISPALKEYESKVLTAEERLAALESALFQELRQEIAQYAERALKTAQAIAEIDALFSLAEVAQKQHYCCPHIDNGDLISIEEGRHPVIEQVCKQERFTPNDTYLNDQESRLLLITGPNMAGKSTYLRQVALIVIMAQIGSFVPAKRAHIGLVDKVFTRIGASDDLSRGQSTFMVEMSETANILHHATSKSLVILDEIGRGTSTYDGISIAWSIAEYLLTTEGRKAKTLFATHYFELTKLEEKIPGALNYNVAVHESEGEITFLRKIVRGGADKSYGIHVAKLAGMPLVLIQRSQEILQHLEENANRKNTFEPAPGTHPHKKVAVRKAKSHPRNFQLSLFEIEETKPIENE